MTPAAPTPEQTARLGYFICTLTSILWGLQALYWYALKDVGLVEVLSWRAVVTTAFLLFLLYRLKLLKFVRERFSLRVLLIGLGFSFLLFFQWSLNVWAVTHGKVIESSVAFFLSPLFTVLLALLLLRENLRPRQWLAIGLAGVGLLMQALLLDGFPWLAVSMGALFALYSVLRRLSPIGSLHGLFIEHTLLSVPALFYIAWTLNHRQSAFQLHGLDIQLLLLGSGVVMTIPLIAFFVSLRMINVSTAGLLTYLTPLIQFMLGIFFFREPLSFYQLASISMIWLALIVYTLEGRGFVRAKRRQRDQAPAAEPPKEPAAGGPDTTLVEENPEEESTLPLEPALAANSTALDFALEEPEPEKAAD